MIMKQIQQIATLALASLLALNLSGCSEKDEPAATDTEKGIAIESINAVMEGMESNNGGTVTRATTLTGFSVNTNADPTIAKPEERTDWKMDFTMYNNNPSSNNPYADGSFTTTYNSSENKWKAPEGKYFPNYYKPQAKAIIYPQGWTDATEIEKEQSTTTALLKQDILIKGKGPIDVAHNFTITVSHKHSMLDFVIADVVAEDIDEVTVWIGDKEYAPYKVPSVQEYMLILPEGTKETKNNPVVQIKTKANDDTGSSAITYKQTIKILQNETATLGSNNCYCFTLQGTDLKISPVTILNWATGESLPGEYIAVTAYPTFKAEGYAGKTYYFYYDNKLTVGGKPKLQEITFNENAECTIKPDGRVLTHIYAKDQVDDIAGSEYKTPKESTTPLFDGTIILNEMVIDLVTRNALPQKP